MKSENRTIRSALWTVVTGCVGLCIFSVITVHAGSGTPDDFDNKGNKIFAAQREIPEIYLRADSGERVLANFYSLRQYPGSPPRIPHEVDLSFSGNETDCLACHEKGGYSADFGAFAPVTPHPENILCYQCHVQVKTESLFVPSDWKSIAPPRLGRSSLGSSPPPIPHTLQLRENCLACHTGPGAVVEIRVSHAGRGDCRQCHVAYTQTDTVKAFNRPVEQKK